jgi:hypothetical protein
MKTTLRLSFTTAACLCAVLSAKGQASFTKVITGPIATDRGNFGGATWSDFRNGGLLDLLVCDYAGGTNGFYRNNGDGTFAKITNAPFTQGGLYQVGPAAADFANGGYLDLFISAGSAAPTARPNRLYYNDGDGTFTPVSGGGITNFTGFWNGGGAVDYDNDGFVDLFIPGVDTPSLLFHNNGDGTFKRTTSAGSIVTDVVNNSSLAWVDYDNDGFMDCFISYAQATRNYLYHNNGNGTFTRITAANPIVTDSWPDGPWGQAWGDYDNDGLPDLFVTGMTSTNRLYHNNGGGVFTNVTSGPMLKAPSGGGFRCCAWGDYDNDGYLDLFLGSYNATNRLFHNNGDGTFTQVTNDVFSSDSNAGIYCQSCGFVDYDNDGFLDLFVTRGADVGQTSNLLYHNNRNGNGNSNAWLEVKLVGTAANRSAIGAKVRLHATIVGKAFWQMREVKNDEGRFIHPLVAHFGLGDATNVDMLRIEWPSGIVQTFSNVPPRQILTVVEHQQITVPAPPTVTSASVPTNGVVNLTASGATNLLYLIEGSTNLVNWAKLGVVSNASGSLQFTDTHATSYAKRFYRVSIP